MSTAWCRTVGRAGHWWEWASRRDRWRRIIWNCRRSYNSPRFRIVFIDELSDSDGNLWCLSDRFSWSWSGSDLGRVVEGSFIPNNIARNDDLAVDQVPEFPCLVFHWIVKEDALFCVRLELGAFVFLDVDIGDAAKDARSGDVGCTAMPAFMRRLVTRACGGETVERPDDGKESFSPEGIRESRLCQICDNPFSNISICAFRNAIGVGSCTGRVLVLNTKFSEAVTKTGSHEFSTLVVSQNEKAGLGTEAGFCLGNYPVERLKDFVGLFGFE